jgi:hypothetical protein
MAYSEFTLTKVRETFRSHLLIKFHSLHPEFGCTRLKILETLM